MKLLPQLLFTTTVLLTPLSSLANDINEWLVKADSYRQQEQNMRVITHVRLFKNNELQKSKVYEVFIKPNRQSLVVFKNSGEKGVKVLMMQDKFWMIMPKSRRPIRITPMQKLLGEASTGDIATMSWSDDYSATLQKSVEIDDQPADVLKLTANKKGLSYQTIQLYLEPDSHKPIAADLYVSSGKLAKQAVFKYASINNETLINKMILTDNIQKGRVTEVEYISREGYSLDDKFYNPRYLARNKKIRIK